MPQRPQTIGEFCRRIAAVIPFLQDNRETGFRIRVGGVEQVVTGSEILATDDIRDIAAGASCEGRTDPLPDMPEVELYLATLYTVEEEKAKSDRMRMYLIGGAVVLGGGLLYFAMRSRREARTMAALEMAGTKCCPMGTRVLKNGSCHDGRKFVAKVPCVQRHAIYPVGRSGPSVRRSYTYRVG